jgi:hypothetical protein
VELRAQRIASAPVRVFMSTFLPFSLEDSHRFAIGRCRPELAADASGFEDMKDHVKGE